MPTQIFFALSEEVDPRFEVYKSQITIMGMGKLNAALALTNFIKSLSDKELQRWWIVNLGTAGSNTFAVGSLVEITSFYERGTVFKSPSLQLPKQTHLPQAICASGDNIEKIENHYPWNCVDMEAYGLAKVCIENKLPFVSIKYITDNSEGSVKSDWKKNLALAKSQLYQFWIDHLLSKST